MEKMITDTKIIQDSMMKVIKLAVEQLDEDKIDIDHIEIKVVYNDGFDYVEVNS